MAKVKICGLSRECDIQVVNEVKPDYIGFVFADSKRQVTAEQAQKLRGKLSRDIQAVGVFVNKPLEQVIEIVEAGIIDLVQLHGQETPQYIQELKMKSTVPVIQAVRVCTKEDVIHAQDSEADYLLFDNGNGGTGERFDWGLIGELKKPFFLAGGLNCENVRDAIISVNPFAVDTSSGVESGGYKDKNKIEEFVRRARNV